MTFRNKLFYTFLFFIFVSCAKEKEKVLYKIPKEEKLSFIKLASVLDDTILLFVRKNQGFSKYVVKIPVLNPSNIIKKSVNFIVVDGKIFKYKNELFYFKYLLNILLEFDSKFNFKKEYRLGFIGKNKFVRNIFVQDGKMYIVAPDEKGMFKIFDLERKIYKDTSLGEVPDDFIEYPSIYASCYFKDTFIIFSPCRPKLFIYKDFELIDSVNFPFEVGIGKINVSDKIGFYPLKGVFNMFYKDNRIYMSYVNLENNKYFLIEFNLKKKEFRKFLLPYSLIIFYKDEKGFYGYNQKEVMWLSYDMVYRQKSG